MLVGAWIALAVAVAAFVIAFLQNGLILLYVAIGASAVSMALVVGYLLRATSPRAGQPGDPGAQRQSAP